MSAPVVNYIRDAELVRLIDGDTAVLNVDLGFDIWAKKTVRLLGVDTPEVRGVESLAGKYVVRQLEGLLNGQSKMVLDSQQFDSGKFGRCLGRIWLGDTCLNDWLLLNRLSWPTDESGKIVGQRGLEKLDLPGGIVQQCKEKMI